MLRRFLWCSSLSTCLCAFLPTATFFSIFLRLCLSSVVIRKTKAWSSSPNRFQSWALMLNPCSPIHSEGRRRWLRCGLSVCCLLLPECAFLCTVLVLWDHASGGMYCCGVFARQTSKRSRRRSSFSLELLRFRFFFCLCCREFPFLSQQATVFDWLKLRVNCFWLMDWLFPWSYFCGICAGCCRHARRITGCSTSRVCFLRGMVLWAASLFYSPKLRDVRELQACYILQSSTIFWWMDSQRGSFRCGTQIGAVVTQPPSVKGRGRKQIMPSAVAERALARNFPASLIWSPDKASEVSSWICKFLKTCSSISKLRNLFFSKFKTLNNNQQCTCLLHLNNGVADSSICSFLSLDCKALYCSFVFKVCACFWSIVTLQCR